MPASTALAVERLAEGGLVAFPTETVWGLAVRAESATALERLQAWKGRRADNPIALLVSGPRALEVLDFDVSDAAHALMDEFWPGALTLVLPCRHRFPCGLARRDGAVGVRCSSHAEAAELVRRAEAAGAGPLTATSLNRSGNPPARTRDEAAVLCGGGAADPLLLPGDLDAGGETPSTVIDLTGRCPSVLREGGLALEASHWLEERGFATFTGRAATTNGEDS
jgi:L-threonylcarbamoyladenylate synthase